MGADSSCEPLHSFLICSSVVGPLAQGSRIFAGEESGSWVGSGGRCRSSSPAWAEIWPNPAMKLVGPLAARSPGLGLRLALALEIERHGSADEILQSRLIELVVFVDVDGAPDIPVEAGVE